MKKNEKIEIKDINEILPFCPCGMGCHLCSGCPSILKYSLYEYYRYYKESCEVGDENRTFEDWLNFFTVSSDILKNLENKYKNEKENVK